MKTTEEIRERLQVLQQGKEMLLYPPMLFEWSGEEYAARAVEDEVVNLLYSHTDTATIQPTLGSLNAEIAALTWVLGGVAK